jgi:hypothetical protein
MTIDNTSEFVTLSQAAELIGGKGSKKSTIGQAIIKGKLKAFKDGGKWQIARSDLYALYPKAIPVVPSPDLNEIIADLRHELQQEKERTSDLSKSRISLLAENMKLKLSRQNNNFEHSIEGLEKLLDAIIAFNPGANDSDNLMPKTLKALSEYCLQLNNYFDNKRNWEHFNRDSLNKAIPYGLPFNPKSDKIKE